ncbi:MAG: hypothetical protein LBQ34_06570 [Alphaproteobacteria bacterium]|jgi:hypothetical protein|nr:hypothetical protein [Alphaproteobacteria bacterium]
MTNVAKRPELEHYDIKQQFNNLLYNSTKLIEQYDDLLLQIKDSTEDLSIRELIDNHYNKIAISSRQMNGIRHTFRRFYKIYDVEKHLKL